MQDLPHHYDVSASAEQEGTVLLKAEGLPQLISAPPAEFGGPGDQWSPEHLLVSAVADCFVLSFRAMARVSKMEWKNLKVSAEGVLDRVERVMKFTAFNIQATLTVPRGTNLDKARRLMEKAEAACLVTNSMTAEIQLELEIVEG